MSSGPQQLTAFVHICGHTAVGIQAGKVPTMPSESWEDGLMNSVGHAVKAITIASFGWRSSPAGRGTETRMPTSGPHNSSVCVNTYGHTAVGTRARRIKMPTMSSASWDGGFKASVLHAAAHQVAAEEL